jgi:hypothetical protein
MIHGTIIKKLKKKKKKNKNKNKTKQKEKDTMGKLTLGEHFQS